MKNLLKFAFALAVFACVFALTASFDVAETTSAVIGSTSVLTAFALPIVTIPDFTEKSTTEVDAMSREELSNYLTEKKNHEFAVLRKQLHDDISSAVKENSSTEAVEALQVKMGKLVEEQDAALLRIKSLTESPEVPVKKTLIDTLKEKAEDIKNFVSKGAGKISFEIATKASQAPTDIANREDLGQYLAGVGQIAHRRTYLKDRIRVVPTNKEYVRYTDQATVVRDAKNTAACATTTSNTKLTWTVSDLKIKKVRDFVDVCIDMLDDYDFMQSEIDNLISSSVALKVDSSLLLDDGTGDLLNGIASYSSTFNAAAAGADYSLSVQAPTLIDLIVVAAAQIMEFGGQNFFMADTVYLNPKDYTLMKLSKDNDDNYIQSGNVDPRIFQNNAGQIFIDGNILVIPNPNVPENEAFVFDSMKATVYQRKTAVVEMSFENNANFEKEVVTVKAYERLNMLVRNVDANAFTHIADIAAGITAITKP